MLAASTCLSFDNVTGVVLSAGTVKLQDNIYSVRSQEHVRLMVRNAML